MTKCKFCGEEIQEAAIKCRFCGEWLNKEETATEKNQPKPKKKTSTLFVLFVIFSIAAIAYNLESSDKNTSSSYKTSPSVSENKPTEKTYKLKENVPVGYFTFYIGAVKDMNEVGNEFYSKKASGVYKVIYLGAVNNDKESRYLDSTMFKIIDDKGRTFDVSTEANSALIMEYANQKNKPEDLFLKQLNPSLGTSGILVFDVPEDAKGLKLEIRGGMVSSDKAYVDLQ